MAAPNDRLPEIMEDPGKEFAEFFNGYALNFNRDLKGETPDVEWMANAFAEHFIEASPSGVKAGSNNDAFRKAIEGGWSFYRSMGIQSMEIVSNEVRVLDPLHALVETRWKSLYSKPGKVFKTRQAGWRC